MVDQVEPIPFRSATGDPSCQRASTEGRLLPRSLGCRSILLLPGSIGVGCA